ncbi:transcriptional repressor LexA [Verrucomicrobiota bacterium]
MEKLTQRQRKILDWILRFVRRNNMPPTVREIGAAFEISSAGVFGHLRALEKKGYLKRGKLGARSIELMPQSAHEGGYFDSSYSARIPVVGRIAAGTPLFAEENIDGLLCVDRKLMRGSGKFFALRVKGDSMIEDGIFDGDLVIVHKQSTAHNGDVVVALMEDEATLKRFYHEGRRIRLQPANAGMNPIYTKNVTIQGVVTGLIRGMGRRQN